MKKNNYIILLLLHLTLMIYSISGVCIKLAAKESFLGLRFIFYYTIVIFILFIYSVAWQQIIKRMPLTKAFANKAITIIWGVLWGKLIFHETLSLGKCLGAFLVIMAVILYTTDRESENG